MINWILSLLFSIATTIAGFIDSLVSPLADRLGVSTLPLTRILNYLTLTFGSFLNQGLNLLPVSRKIIFILFEYQILKFSVLLTVKLIKKAISIWHNLK